MEIIYNRKLLYYIVMTRTFSKLFEYGKLLSKTDEINFCNDLIDIEEQLCKIFDKIIDINKIHEGKVLLYIARQQDLENPQQIISQTSIIKSITKSFRSKERTGDNVIQDTLKDLKKKGYIIDEFKNNRHNLKLNLEGYPELKIFIELIKKWDIPLKYIKAKKKIYLSVESKGRMVSSQKSLIMASVSAKKARGV